MASVMLTAKLILNDGEKQTLPEVRYAWLLLIRLSAQLAYAQSPPCACGLRGALLNIPAMVT